MSLGHKLTIKGEGLRGNRYDVTFDGEPLHGTEITLSMGIDQPTMATIKVYISELDADIDTVADSPFEPFATDPPTSLWDDVKDAVGLKPKAGEGHG